MLRQSKADWKFVVGHAPPENFEDSVAPISSVLGVIGNCWLINLVIYPDDMSWWSIGDSKILNFWDLDVVPVSHLRNRTSVPVGSAANSWSLFKVWWDLMGLLRISWDSAGIAHGADARSGRIGLHGRRFSVNCIAPFVGKNKQWKRGLHLCSPHDMGKPTTQPLLSDV